MWFMDGTHSTAPQQFKQVFTVRVLLGETSATAAYALLPSKTQEVYEECLTAILDACLRRNIRPNPTKVVTDYEMAIHNAVHAVLSNTIEIQGCFYHLTQSTWRYLQGEGLQATYREDPDIRQFCGMLDGLAFLPEDQVKEGMAYLKSQTTEVLEPVVDYFDRNYVNGPFRSVRSQTGGLIFRRTQPRFEPATWNVNTATLNDEARTNNVCEAWNNGFRCLVGHVNPSLWTVISCFEKDAAMVEAEILRVQRGQPSKKPARKGTVRYQKTLKTLCQQLSNGQKTVEEFLQAIGGHIRLR
ncbi:uncharacterized protein LOC128232033 [Mya arenaria]|uniref:uncharacterized protein LOC128232033 n=2 Tax=Mya arenaria TaxID=6604 RepID=UPI0022E02298|nr:uncharacterized protein LOC128232033 [Mya arenaria]